MSTPSQTMEWEFHGPAGEALLETVHRLTLVAQYLDEGAHSHCRRVRCYTGLIANRLGISGADAGIMAFSSPMHDIGMVAVPDSILLKPEKLTAEEFELMKTHTTIGAKILGNSDNPYLVSASKFAVSHHERWDGSGYPFGLIGEEIPIEGRIMYLVDKYDTLRSRRPYKPSFQHEASVLILTRGNYNTRPEHFDPRILDIFASCEQDFRDIFDSNPTL